MFTPLLSLWENFLANPMTSIYWFIAIVASVVFVFQTISLFVGFDTDTDFSGGDLSFDIDGLQLISVKTVACFLLGFGWTGVLFGRVIESAVLLAVVAILAGVAFMLLIAFMLRQVLLLSQDNTFHVHKSVGRVAEVYLRIPATNTQGGKIIVSVNGTIHELLAVASEDEEIPTGAKVRIVSVVDEDTVLVERI